MDEVTPPFELDYGPPGTWVRHPRLWRLTVGLLITAGVAAAIPWLSGWSGWWAATPDRDMRLGMVAVGAGGLAMALHALARDLLHVESVRFSADGLRLRWSYVPQLWGQRVEEERQWAWRDVVQLEWREGSLEHDLKQHLVLHLKPPLNPGHQGLKLLVCDDRNADHCAALMARLPTGVTAPHWLAAEQLQHQKHTAKTQNAELS